MTCQSAISTTTTMAETTTTTVGEPTTTTTTVVTASSTTTLPVPNNPEFSFLFTPSDLRPTLAQSPQFSGDIVDPRNGIPANQLLLATIMWQLEAYSMEAVALGDAVGCDFNEQQILDSNFKFGADYVLEHQAFPSGGTYNWGQPTYVRQYTLPTVIAVAHCLQAKGIVPPDLARVAGLEFGPTSPAPDTINTSIQGNAYNYTPGHYAPLGADQCALLAAADAAHMAHDNAFLAHDFVTAAANNQAVLDAQRAFEGSARNYNEATLFKWVWQGNYNRGNPQPVNDGLTRQIIAAHHEVMLAYNCASGGPPNAARIVHYMLLHNFLHDCRATTHWLDVAIPTVCDTTQIQSCPRRTCRAQGLAG